MDWQRYVLDVALEYDPETGFPYYRNVTVTVPRQNGKTTMLLVLFLVRALANEKQSIIYTMQDRNEAKKKLVNEWIPLLEETNFRNYFTTTQANGNEAMKFHNGSLLSLAATTKRSAHGNVIHLGVADEAFALPDARMEQAFIPAMRTKKDAQYWVISTAGTFAESPYLWSKVEQGRVLVRDDIRDGTCYFEWSADEDADPALESTWLSCMPALGVTMDVATIRGEYQAAVTSNNLSEFKRAALNQWVTAKTDPVISLERWKQLIVPEDEDEVTAQWALAFDVAEDRSSSSIAASWKRPDDKWQVVLIESAPGTNWVAQAIADIWHNRRPIGIWLDRNGPAGSLISDLQTLNVPLVNDVPVADLAKGCGQFFDACKEGTLAHYDDPQLIVSLDGAVKRPVSDAWVWSRRASNIDISPLVAITMALYGAKENSRTPQVFSIREIMDEKIARKAAELDAIADAVSGEEQPMVFHDVTPQSNQPEPTQQNPVSNVRRTPI
jgi:phage terminase large subunit-like protein